MIPQRPEGIGFIESFGYALFGIRESAKGRNFKVQLFCGILAIVLGLLFHISQVEWLVVVVCIGLVLGGECMNTALEAVVDLASPDIHPYAKLAKDAAAGAVLCFSLSSLVLGGIIFIPKIMTLIAG